MTSVISPSVPFFTKAIPSGDNILDTGNVSRALNFDAPVDEPEVGESPLDFIKRKASELKERYSTKPVLAQQDDIANSLPAGGDDVLDRLNVSRLKQKQQIILGTIVKCLLM